MHRFYPTGRIAKIKSRPHEEGHPVFARFWRYAHKLVDPLRGGFIASAQGNVLEIGAGGGENIPFYQQARQVTLTEPDPSMRRYAEKALADAPVPVTLVSAPAEKLPFPDQQFDTVVSTFVVCSVKNPQQALAEIYRVLKPGGEFRFMEHVRSNQAVAAHIQDWLTPIQRRLFAGCHLNRRTLDTIRQAGFDIRYLNKPVPYAPIYEGSAIRR